MSTFPGGVGPTVTTGRQIFGECEDPGSGIGVGDFRHWVLTNFPSKMPAQRMLTTSTRPTRCLVCSQHVNGCPYGVALAVVVVAVVANTAKTMPEALRRNARISLMGF